MLNPTPLLSSLRFRVAGSSQVAGEPPSQLTPLPARKIHATGGLLELHELGTGAQHYQLEVDQERGVLLAVTAFRNERPSTRSPRSRSASTSRSRPRPSSSRHRKAKRSSPLESPPACSTSRSPKRSSAPRSPFSCQTVCPPAGRCTACSLKPLSGRHRRRRSRSATAPTTDTRASRSRRWPRLAALPSLREHDQRRELARGDPRWDVGQGQTSRMGSGAGTPRTRRNVRIPRLRQPHQATNSQRSLPASGPHRAPAASDDERYPQFAVYPQIGDLR